ncbi:7 transmembrane receptor (Secretin family) domain-containing protein [Phthorimaea operculella]|nr:7 transmembrane receptor (Secretin family) domain-containing protein [Phthorimaea operculella]
MKLIQMVLASVLAEELNIVKMVSLHRSVAGVVLIFICINITANAKKYVCPIGFSLAFTKFKGDDPICYRRKGPEAFDDKFKDCTGNLFTTKLYNSLNFTATNLVLWTDYKSPYPGGPFVDQSFTDAVGDTPIVKEVKYDQRLGINEELCVVIDPITNLTAARCDENHYRYCFVKPYEKQSRMDKDGCEKEDYWRFYSPKATCLTALTGVGGGTVRANWRQSKDLCAKRGGALLSRGWRFANHHMLSSSTNPTFPLGIVLGDNSTIRYDTSTEEDEIPTSEWYFENKVAGVDTSLGALRDNFWYMVNNSFIFYDVICEKPIRLQPVSLNVYIDDDKLILKTNDSIDVKYIRCLSDSTTYYPKGVKVQYDDGDNAFILKPVDDGYYWCISIDSKNHVVSESNKVLFIRVKQSVLNSYAISIILDEPYKFDNLVTAKRDWEKKLEDYIYYRTRYVSVYGEFELKEGAEEKIKNFKADTERTMGSDAKDLKTINNLKIKRLYLNRKKALVHVQLNRAMMAVGPGRWDDLEVEYMKPVYFCMGFDTVPTKALGTSLDRDCRNYTCIGDFNEGVQWVTTAVEGCTTLAPMTAAVDVRVEAEVYDIIPTVRPRATTTDEPYRKGDSSSEEEYTKMPWWNTTVTPTSTEVTTPDPSEVSTVTTVNPDEIVSTVTVPYTTETISTVVPVLPTTLPPDQLIQQVLDSLESLLSQENSIPITVDDVEDTFDQVDGLLNLEDDLEIPGDFLHLLDQLGARVNLNGSEQASAVRSNIALVLADSTPENPVRGLRIAATDQEVFTQGDFEIISDEVNDTQLASNSSEAVVQLPDSIANSTRRISFVVFRTERAFRSQTYNVNSKVLSINVENLTQFEDGEVIDIHLSPLLEEPGRNQTRTCAYWHFDENGTGGDWSQEGCTFIRSTEPGMLDTCRCDHLTHFAEILAPRAIFSDRNEMALEILTIIGCIMSMFGLLMIGLTAGMFRSWRRDYSNKIWLQLCIAIFFLVTCFLIAVFARFDMYDVPCMLVGVMLHYSVLASFCWMLVAAVLSYRRLVIVFSRDASHKLLRASAFSWGAPCAIVGVLLSVNPHAYAGRFEEKSPSGSFCYPSDLALWLTVYAPIAIMLLANWTLFALIVRSVFASRRIQRHGDTNEAVRCASVSCLLVFLFGLPWIFGLFAFNIVAAYLFTLTATFQGFVLFMFFVLGNKKTRDLWLNKLKIKQTRKVPVTSSTYTHRSTGHRPGMGASLMESNSQKPRSLTSPDNSRFS